MKKKMAQKREGAKTIWCLKGAQALKILPFLAKVLPEF